MRFKNKFIIMLIIVLIISLFNPISKSKAFSLDDMLTSADEFLGIGKNSDRMQIDNMADVIYNILLILGIVVAVIMGMVLGIKFMTAGAAEKAKVKENLIVYVAGCIVIFGAFTIWKIVLTVLQSTN